MHVAVVGATGAVGELIRKVLEERQFPVTDIRFLASPRSASRSVEFRGATHPVEPIRAEAFDGIDIVLSSTPSAVSREFSPIAARAGATVIDNSSAWRMDPDVPLVVPEVNAEALQRIPKGIVANPNCVAIPLTVALAPLHRVAGLKRVVVSTYQSSSGKGAKGLAELDAQLQALGRGEAVPPAVAHKARLAGNVLPHDWTTYDDGFTEEETKVVQETKKILGADVPVAATCVRVPVRISHSLSVAAEFDRPLDVERAKEALRAAAGVVLCDDAPLPLHIEGRDEVFVGRIRRDPTVPSGLLLWVVADNLRKGAATNAVQVAQALLALR
jgi:aspartate-semialdehyde dehydrogenase